MADLIPPAKERLATAEREINAKSPPSGRRQLFDTSDQRAGHSRGCVPLPHSKSQTNYGHVPVGAGSSTATRTFPPHRSDEHSSTEIATWLRRLSYTS